MYMIVDMMGGCVRGMLVEALTFYHSISSSPLDRIPLLRSSPHMHSSIHLHLYHSVSLSSPHSLLPLVRRHRVSVLPPPVLYRRQRNH